MIQTERKHPSPEKYFQLQSDPGVFLSQIFHMDTVYLQTRTDCGGLGKITHLDGIFYDPENDTIQSPASGWMISLDQLLAVNATKNDAAIDGMFAFDFEFIGRPCGCSIYASESFANMDGYFSLLDAFFDTPTSRDHLDNWREQMAPVDSHCPECEKVSKMRMAYPERHPLYEIAQNLINTETPLFARLLSNHSDLTATMTPESIMVDCGIISLVDRDSTVVSLNMRNLHTTVIKNKVIDGQTVSALECHNSIGRQGMEILVEDPDLAIEWTEIFQSK